MGNSRIIVAIDSQEKHKALDLARNLSDDIFGIKINWPLVLEEGAEIISKISRYSRVICDFKVADIPNTNRLIAGKVHSHGAYGIIAHAVTGEDSLRAITGVSADLKLITVVAMSHPGAQAFLNPLSERLIAVARSVGSYGIVAPGNATGIIARLRADAGEMKIFSPGIGAQGGNPVEAIKAGADYVIIGRTIYQSDDPVEAVSRYNAEISASGIR